MSKLNLTLSLAVLLFGALSVVPEPLFAQSQSARGRTGVEARTDQIFAAYAKPNSPGCAIGVIQNRDFAYRKAYGMGSLELGVPLSPESVFYMGSVSKQFTAASIVLAVEQGFLSLDDNIRKYIPEIPDYGHPITLRQMLHHTSGIPDAVAMIAMSGRNPEDLHPTAELMDLIVRQKVLNFTPGEQYLYSNTNYFLLAEVIKRATGKPLQQFATDNIFKPLGMMHTRFYDDHTVVVSGRVPAYRPGKDGEFLVDWSTNYEAVGAGGLMSSVDDLLLWDRNFYDNKLGNGTLLKEMQTRGVLNNGKESGYALGLTMGAYRGLPTVEHDGANFGYRTEILRFPQQKFTVLTLCNLASADPGALAHKVADIYLGNELQPPPAPIAGSNPALFAGKYFDSRTHYLVSFNFEGGNLVLQGHTLEAIGTDQFKDPIVGGTATFSTDGRSVKAAVTYDNAVTFTGTRIEDLHLDERFLANYVGVYKSAELDTTYTLSVEDGSLTLRVNRHPAVKLEPIVQNEFDSGGMTLVFRRDSGGRVSGLTVFSGWDGLVRNENFEKTN